MKQRNGSTTLKLVRPAAAAVKAPPEVRDAAPVRGDLDEAGRGLLEQLAKLQGLLKELLDLGHEKLSLLRTANSDGLHACAARESRLLEQVFRSDQQRHAVLARVAQGLRLSNAAPASLSKIADAAPEPLSSSIRARMRPLAEISSELQRINRVASIVARDLQGHIRGVFAALAETGRERVGYGPQGRQSHLKKDAWLDAVG